MCGIAGILSKDKLPEAVDTVTQMLEGLQHRGPDGGGAHDSGFGVVGMRRLSIVDIEGGHQPMLTKDGRWILVYNGELYDYQRRRQILSRRGYEFRTQSDTEVLLAELVLDGTKALMNLNGMFAFCLIDHHKRRAVLARDRYGIKPLYYHCCPRTGRLSFASELGALLMHRSIQRRLDHDSLRMLLENRYVADPWTLFEGVHQLPPGHLLQWDIDDGIALQRYYKRELTPSAIKEEDALSELKERLSESVRSQLIADVPVGVLLSGGVDSSTVAAYAARHSGRIKSFTLGSAAKTHDESAMARRIAHHLGSEHHEIHLRDAGFDEDLLERIVDHVGQPLGDPSCIPMFAISRLVSSNIKAVLSGDGGDEFFGGYNHIRWASRVQNMSRWPARLCVPALQALMLVARGETGRRWRKALRIARLRREDQLPAIMGLWSREELDTLLVDETRGRDSYARFFNEVSHLRGSEEIMYVLRNSFLPGAILTKVDRMSMAHSLEVRVPLLDNRVTEFADGLPLSLKLRGGVGKYLLREAGRSLLPEFVYDEAKRGFSIPLQRWFNGRFWEILREAYGPKQPLSQLFDRRQLDMLLTDEAVCEGISEMNLATRRWVLVQLALWTERFRVSI